MRSILSTTKLGAHIINGTEFPMVAQLSRFAPAGRRPVYTVAQVCNGDVHTSDDYRRRCDAEEHVAGLVKVYAC